MTDRDKPTHIQRKIKSVRERESKYERGRNGETNLERESNSHCESGEREKRETRWTQRESEKETRETEREGELERARKTDT